MGGGGHVVCIEYYEYAAGETPIINRKFLFRSISFSQITILVARQI